MENITTWVKQAETKQWNQLQADRYLNSLVPNEIHNIGGDCINPACDYPFTYEDLQSMENFSGWFTCPQCNQTYNYMNDVNQNKTRAGISMDQMGSIGEEIVVRMGVLPGVGPVHEIYQVKHHPIDGVIGPYGVEIKTNHSEAQPRFKVGGEWVFVPSENRSLPPRRGKEVYCQQNGLVPGLVGVRLNFYSSRADVFFREGFIDTWIGNKSLQYCGQEDFSDLNPFNTMEVPPASELPDDDTTPADGIPF